MLKNLPKVQKKIVKDAHDQSRKALHLLLQMVEQIYNIIKEGYPLEGKTLLQKSQKSQKAVSLQYKDSEQTNAYAVYLSSFASINISVSTVR